MSLKEVDINGSLIIKVVILEDGLVIEILLLIGKMMDLKLEILKIRLSGMRNFILKNRLVGPMFLVV